MLNKQCPDERCKGIYDEVCSLMEMAMKGEALVKNCRTIFDVLLRASIAVYMTISPMLVGVHPENRDGLGLIISHVVDLLPKILGVGWSNKEAFGVCMDMAQKHMQTFTEFNSKLVAASGGVLADCAAESIKFVSLWGSHTNQVLRLVHTQGGHTSCPEICIDNKISLEKLQARDSAFYDAAKYGMKWLVIPYWVFDCFPGLAKLVQEAGNATTHLLRGEHDFQLMRKLAYVHQSLKAQLRTTPTYKQVKAVVVKSQPRNQAALPLMYSLVLNHAGGDDLPHLKDCEAFLNGNVKNDKSFSDRQISQEFLEQVTADLQGVEQCRFWRWACIKAFYAGKPLNTSDVRKGTSKNLIAKVLEANANMQELKELCCGSELMDNAFACNIRGHIEIALVMYVLEKKLPTDWPSQLAIMADAVKQIKEATDKYITTKWDAHRMADEPGSASTPAPPHDFVGFGTDMTVILMRNLGFKVGDSFAEKSDVTVVYTITTPPFDQSLFAVHANHVKLNDGL